MSKSLKKNFVYSGILTTSGYIFPLLTYPYVSRVLGVEHLGTNNFVSNVVNYFITLSMLGMSVVGTREIAAATKEERNRVFSSLFTLSLLTTVISSIALFLASLFVPRFIQNQMMFIVGSLHVLFNFFQMEWLFRGLEDFKYITMRSLAIKVAYVFAVFGVVRDTNDYDLYYYLSVAMTFINAAINVIYSRKYVRYSVFNIELRKYSKPYLVYGLYMIFTSLYTTLNVGVLGFFCNDTQVGYYTTSTKLYGIILSVFTAFTGVMMPRMSSLISCGMIDEFKRLTTRSYNLLILFSIPLVIFFVIMAPQVIMIISGSGYEGAVLPMMIVMPLILIIGIEQIQIIQTLMPLKKDKQVLRNTLIGGSIGLTMNFILVPILQSVGSAIVWTISEITIMLLSFRTLNKYLEFNFPWKKMISYIVYCIPMAIAIYILSKLTNYIIAVFASFLLMLVYCYLINIVILKDKEALSIYKMVKDKLIRKSD